MNVVLLYVCSSGRAVAICLFGKHCELELAHKLARQKWQHANHLCADTVSGTVHAEANLSPASQLYTVFHNEHAR